MHGHGIAGLGMMHPQTQVSLERTAQTQQAAAVRRKLREGAGEIEAEGSGDADSLLMVTAWGGESGGRGGQGAQGGSGDGGERQSAPGREKGAAGEDEGSEAVSFWA